MERIETPSSSLQELMVHCAAIWNIIMERSECLICVHFFFISQFQSLDISLRGNVLTVKNVLFSKFCKAGPSQTPMSFPLFSCLLNALNLSIPSYDCGDSPSILILLPQLRDNFFSSNDTPMFPFDLLYHISTCTKPLFYSMFCSSSKLCV